MTVPKQIKHYVVPKPAPPRPAPETVTVDVKDLKDHPAAVRYSDAIRRAADFLRDAAAGEAPPTVVEILADGTVAGGDEVVELARRAGRERIPAVVRHDLGDDLFAAELVLARDWLGVVDDTPLERARLYRALLRKADDRPRPRRRFSAADLHAHAKRVARELGVELDGFNDVVAAPAAPPAVRAAFDAGTVTARQAARSAQLPPHEAAAVHAAVRAAEPEEAGRVVAERLDAAEANGRDPAEAYFGRIEQLMGIITEVCRSTPPDCVDPIRLAAKLEALEQAAEDLCDLGDRAEAFDAGMAGPARRVGLGAAGCARGGPDDRLRAADQRPDGGIGALANKDAVGSEVRRPWTLFPRPP